MIYMFTIIVLGLTALLLGIQILTKLFWLLFKPKKLIKAVEDKGTPWNAWILDIFISISQEVAFIWATYYLIQNYY